MHNNTKKVLLILKNVLIIHVCINGGWQDTFVPNFQIKKFKNVTNAIIKLNETGAKCERVSFLKKLILFNFIDFKFI